MTARSGRRRQAGRASAAPRRGEGGGERSRAACALAVAVALACSGAAPQPLTRVVSSSPTGVVPPEDVAVEIGFSAAVARAGLDDGRLLGLCRREDLREVVQAAESERGVMPADRLVPAQVRLSPDGTRAVLRPEQPLPASQGWAAVLSPRLRAADGRPVLDPEGHARAFAVLFDTGPARDRTAPRPRWAYPPHGPAPSDLARVAVEFDEPVSGSLALQGEAGPGVPLPAAADVLGLALPPLAPGLLRVDVAGVHDGAGNAAAELEPLPLSPCPAGLPPAVDGVEVTAGTLSVRLTARLSAMAALVAEVTSLPGAGGCGAVPAAPATVRVAGGVLACPGWDPCARATTCPAAVEVPGLCPGQPVRVRLWGEDLAGHAGRADAWREVAALAPAASPTVTEVLADAEAPEAGGEYLEVANLGTGDLDLAGHVVVKHTAGKVLRCTVAAAAGARVPPGGHGLVVGGAYDGRYALPPGTPVFRCGAAALAGGLANDRPVALALEDAEGRTVSSVGLGAPAPRCPEGALERVHPAAPDAAENWACPGTRTPGTCNASTPPAECPRRAW